MRWPLEMRSAPFLLPLLLATLPSCVHAHFEPIAASAYVRDNGCDEQTRVSVVPLSDWGFRTQGCGDGEAYYRCWFKRRSGGQVQCCARVPSEKAATSVISFKEGVPMCTPVE